MFLLLLHTALRESELLSLDYPDQFSGGYLLNIQRKVTRKLRVPKPARVAIQEYLDEERGEEPAPLFQSKNGRRLAPQNLDDVMKRIAATVVGLPFSLGSGRHLGCPCEEKRR